MATLLILGAGLLLSGCRGEAHTNAQVRGDATVLSQTVVTMDPELRAAVEKVAEPGLLKTVGQYGRFGPDPSIPGASFVQVEPAREGAGTGVSQVVSYLSVQDWVVTEFGRDAQVEITGPVLTLSVPLKTPEQYLVQNVGLRPQDMEKVKNLDVTMTMSLRITVPGPVARSNATRALPDGSLEWDLSETPSRAELTASLVPGLAVPTPAEPPSPSSSRSTAAMLITAAAVLFVLVLLVAAAVLLRRRRRAGSRTRPPVGGVASARDSGAP